MPKKKQEPAEPPPPDYISDPSLVQGYYNVRGVWVGIKVEVDNRPGSIVGFKGYNLAVVYDDDPTQAPYLCHPTWRTKYHRQEKK